MSMWTAIVIIVIVGVVGIVRIAQAIVGADRYRHRRGEADGFNPGLAAENAQLKRELASLNQRLAVLERIATEDRTSKAIAAEIEMLRDS